MKAFLRSVIAKFDYNRWRLMVTLFTAILIAPLIFHYLPIPTQKYITSYSFRQFSENEYQVMHDFDHDGISEKIYFKFDSGSRRWGIKITRSEDEIIDQWNLPHKWLPFAFFGDFDHDLWDELYFFTRTKDSLFLYALDIRYTNKFLLSKVVIATAPKPLPPGVTYWDLLGIKGTMLDADRDGYEDLTISLYTGFALQPRGYLTFSIHKKKIIYKAPLMGAYGGGDLVSFAVQGEDSIVVFSTHNYATNNCPPSMPYPDDRAWLMVFDRKLRFLFPPRSFPPAYTKITIKPIIFPSGIYLAVLQTIGGAINRPHTLFLYDLEGNEISRKDLAANHNWNIFSLPKGRPSQLYLTNDAGEVRELNEHFQTIHRMDIGISLNHFLTEADLDEDLEREFCFATNNGLAIVEPDWSGIETIPVKFYPPYQTSVYSSGRTKPQLVISEPGRIHYIGYQKNAYYLLYFSLKFLLWLTLALTVYGVQTWAYRKWVQYQGMKTLFQENSTGHAILYAQGRIQDINTLFLELCQIREREVQEKYLLNLLDNQPRVRDFVERLLQLHGKLEKEIRIRFYEAEKKIKFRGYPLLNRFGLLMGFAIEAHSQGDVVPDYLQAWSQTVQKMAHDLKTPLSAIQMSLQTLRYKIQDSSPELSNQVNEDIKFIQNELQRVIQSSRNFIRFINLEPPKRRLVYLPEIVQKTVARFKQHFSNGKIQLTIQIEDPAAYLMADPQQLEMLFQILIENAVEALNGEGQILIQAELAQLLDNEIKDFVEILVGDTGIGIDKKMVEKIFDPFYTTKEGGSGMGLTIARKIVHDHGGSILVDSRPGYATIIKILLPKGNIGEADAENISSG